MPRKQREKNAQICLKKLPGFYKYLNPFYHSQLPLRCNLQHPNTAREGGRLILIGLEIILTKFFFNGMPLMLQFNEADLLLTIAKWFFTSLNSGFSQMNVNKSNVDIININYFEWYSGGRGVLFYRPLNPLF